MSAKSWTRPSDRATTTTASEVAFIILEKVQIIRSLLRTRFICKKLSAPDPKPSLKGSFVILNTMYVHY